MEFWAAMEKFTRHIVNMMKVERLYETQLRLRMNMDRWSMNLELRLELIQNGRLKWLWVFEPEFHGSCASKMTPLTRLSIHVMVFTATISLPTKISSQKCGRKHGQDGNITHIIMNDICLSEFGGAVPYRPAEDLAYLVAKFIQSGGSFINYYMYHGGTNFGRTAGGPFIATSYDYDAPLDEFGFE